MRAHALGGSHAARTIGGAILAITMSMWLVGPSPALAGPRDTDGDGMPNVWETATGLDPNRPNASGDPDRDGLKNLGEFRNQADPKDEDADNDGIDDGDEVKVFDTEPDDRDSDDDGIRDGDDDADRDGVADEDEDDFVESCRGDDDDRDSDGIDDEDENELGTSVRDADSDDNGVVDGNEDLDGDGVDEEDQDDDAEDRCEAEEAEEDLDDQIGTISSFDADTGSLTVAMLAGGALGGTITVETRLEWEPRGGDEGDATAADLLPGTAVTEVELDEDTGTLEKVKLLGP